MTDMDKLKSWCDTEGVFIEGVTCTKADEALELLMINYQDEWCIVPADKKNISWCDKENIEAKILPLFGELLKFENPEIVYTVLYMANRIHKLQYSKLYHLDNDIDFDILIKSSCIKDKPVEGLIQIQLNIMPEITSLDILANALVNLPYNFKGIVIYNKNTDENIRFLTENHLSAKNVIDKNNTKQAYFDLYKRGELTNFLVDYPAFEEEAMSYINAEIKPCVNWLQIAFERKLKLVSNDKKLQEIYDEGSISEFMKYDFKNLTSDQFKMIRDQILSYSVDNETFK